MKIQFLKLILFFILFSANYKIANAQRVKNVRFQQKGDLIYIYYDLTGTVGNEYDISIYCIDKKHNEFKTNCGTKITINKRVTRRTEVWNVCDNYPGKNFVGEYMFEVRVSKSNSNFFVKYGIGYSNSFGLSQITQFSDTLFLTPVNFGGLALNASYRRFTGSLNTYLFPASMSKTRMFVLGVGLRYNFALTRFLSIHPIVDVNYSKKRFVSPEWQLFRYYEFPVHFGLGLSAKGNPKSKYAPFEFQLQYKIKSSDFSSNFFETGLIYNFEFY